MADLASEYEGRLWCEHLMNMQALRHNDIDVVVQQLVPIEIETKLGFVLNEVPHASYMMHIKWLLE